MATALGLLALAPPTSAAPTTARADASGGRRVAIPLPAGLSAPEHAALQRSGAFGPHPVRLLILGDSIALTLAWGCRSGRRAQYGVAVSDDATAGL